MKSFDEKVDSIATVLDELPPMQVMKAIEQLAEDDDSRLSPTILSQRQGMSPIGNT